MEENQDKNHEFYPIETTKNLSSEKSDNFRTDLKTFGAAGGWAG